MTTWAQDSGGDLLIVNGKTSLVDGATAGAQKLRNRLRLFQGEWFRDTRQGIPLYTVLFGVKNPDMNVINQFFRGVLAETPGVKDILSLTATFDNAAREVDVAFAVLWDDGLLISAETLDKPFLVSVPGST